MMATPYASGLHRRWENVIRSSAARVVPRVVDLVRPGSVVDVGCGLGFWLDEFERRGVAVLGVDGAWVKPEELEIAADRFVTADLAQPLLLDRQFDLATCLEVAEHLPPEAAATVVTSLTTLAPVILFSAAIPGQGGTNHLNEQWPEYWANLFGEHGYVALDQLRPEIWADDRVAYYYRQNIALYIQQEAIDHYPELRETHDRTAGVVLPLVHPGIYEDKVRRLHGSWRSLVALRARHRAELTQRRNDLTGRSARAVLGLLREVRRWMRAEVVNPRSTAGFVHDVGGD